MMILLYELETQFEYNKQVVLIGIEWRRLEQMILLQHLL
jgi:hypothetical protein